MDTVDINAWKDLLSSLKEISAQNAAVIKDIRTEMELQRQKNKKEIQKVSAQLSNQTLELEELLATLDTDDLFSLPSDQNALKELKSALEDQIEKSRKLLKQTEDMLEVSIAPSSTETAEKVKVGTRSNKEKSLVYAPRNFKKEYLVGNWIHYYDKQNKESQKFTCQTFTPNNVIREYDIQGGSILHQREGTYTIDDQVVEVTFRDGSQARYTVEGFGDSSMDYDINGSKIRFDYMPDELLNSVINASSKIGI